MADFLVRTVLPSHSGLVKDSVVNDLAFHQPGAGTLAQLCTDVEGFYNLGVGAAGAICDYIGASVDRSACITQVYTIPAVAGPLGSPIFVQPFTLGAVDDLYADLPSEVAACVSYHADFTGAVEESGHTRPKARRRGRLYVGPLTTKTLMNEGGVLQPQRISDAFRNVLVAALANMFDAAQGHGFNMCIFSRRDWLLRTAVQTTADNAFDTQRRRGVQSTAKASLPLP